MLLWFCIAWVFASALVALMPMRWQYVPGITLLVLAPVLIYQIALTVGVWASIAGVLAFVSMYRNPLRYFWKRAIGQEMEIPR